MKDIIIGDINGDDSTELVISLTDRVVRTYKWVSSSCLSPPGDSVEETHLQSIHSGRLVSVNKWEFASQIGTVTLNYDTDTTPALLGLSSILKKYFYLQYFSGPTWRSLHEAQVQQRDRAAGQRQGGG